MLSVPRSVFVTMEGVSRESMILSAQGPREARHAYAAV